MKKYLILLLGVIVVAAVAGIAYLSSLQSNSGISTATTNNYKVYRDSLGFSFLYSPELSFRDGQHKEQYGITTIGEFVKNTDLEAIESLHEGGYPSITVQEATIAGDVYNWVNERVINSDAELTATLIAEKGTIYIIPDHKVHHLTINGNAAALFTSHIYLGDYQSLAIQHDKQLLIFTAHNMSFNTMIASLTFSNDTPVVNPSVLSQLTAISSN